MRSDIVGGLARVAGGFRLRIAAGETTAGTAELATLLADGALGVVAVDTTWGGGITNARKWLILLRGLGCRWRPTTALALLP